MFYISKCLIKIVSRLSHTPVSNIQVEFERKHDMRSCVYIYICMRFSVDAFASDVGNEIRLNTIPQ